MKNKNELNSNKKKKSFNYRVLMLPLFFLVTLNLIISIGVSLSAANNQPELNNTLTNSLYASNQFLNTPAIESVSVFLKAQENLQNAKNVKLEVNGEIKSFVTQKVNITRLYDGKTHFTQNITTGFKTFANRIYMQNNKITMVNGSRVSNNSASWNGTSKTYSEKEFEETFFISPKSYLNYNINSVTITNSTPLKEVENGYSFSINLHPEFSIKEYAQAIKRAVGTNNLPKFNSITLNVIVDKNFNFIQIEANENFTLKVFGISKNCTATYKSTFNFSEKQNIAI